MSRACEGESGREGSGGLFPRLAEHLENLDEDMREIFLMKAFLLLADAHGDASTALACLEEAATSNPFFGLGVGERGL